MNLDIISQSLDVLSPPPPHTPTVYKQSEMFRVGIQDVDKMARA